MDDSIRIGHAFQSYRDDPDVIRLGAARVPVLRYLCCGCRHSEEWVAPEYLKRLKRNFSSIKE